MLKPEAFVQLFRALQQDGQCIQASTLFDRLRAAGAPVDPR
jgi:hypothetical protein